MPETLSSRLQGRVHRWRQEGVSAVARRTVDVAGLTMLRAVFRFERWHAVSPLSARPYRRGVAAMVNRIAPHSVVEVGCGLGAMLPLIQATSRTGIDCDPRVIRAARWLHQRTIDFRVGSFDQAPETDVLIAVNWMHDLPPDVLEAIMVPALARSRHLLIDRIGPAAPVPYPYHHDFAFLDGRVEEIDVSSCGEAHRSFHLYRVIG